MVQVVKRCRDDKTDNGARHWAQYLAVMSATIVSIAAGVSIAWPSPSVPRLLAGELHYEVTKAEGSYVAIINALGNIVASPVSALLVDRIGRKPTIMLISLPQLVSFLMIYLSSHSIGLLYAARFLGGLGEGATFTVLAMYIGEIAAPSIRGALGSYLSLTLRVGMLLINVLGTYCSIATASLVCVALPLAACLLGAALMPETPYYHLMRGDRAGALRSLRYLRQRADVGDELHRLERDVARQLSEAGAVADLWRTPSNRRACLVVVGLRTCQQLSGISAFTLYTQQLFAEAGGAVRPSSAANLFSAIQLALTLLSSLLVDVVGRKPLLVFSCVACCALLSVEAAYFALRDYSALPVSAAVGWLPLAGMILYIVAFSVGLGSIVNLMLGELFGQGVKAKALCLTNVYFAIAMSVTTKFFQCMTDAHGLSVPIAVFGACCGAGALFCYYIVPETKGRTLEEIQQLLKGNSSAPPRKRHATTAPTIVTHTDSE